ncbi:hypothetical protein GCM10028778_22790 [Barrientosiimonas marina]|uniref:Alcohol acetyltransferase n=1 Tax=Lentibacillus kimchii TaxID=1542911 RepID=A0ABW2UUI9_9BACI
MDNQLWYRLDHAAKMYSSIVSSRATTLFRVSATLTSQIDATHLQSALEATLRRFPFYKVQLKQGVFWYYLEATSQIPLVEEENYYPCMSLGIKRSGSFLFRVLYYNKRISVELSHSLTDGTGGLKFLQEMIIQYLHLKESIAVNNPEPDQKQLQSEIENSFLKYYEKEIPILKSRIGKSFKLPIALDKKGRYYITTGIIDVTELKQKAHYYETTVTILLTAIYIESLLKIQDDVARRHYPIVINVPVDMRSFFKSETMRNFFVSISPSIDSRLGNYEFTEIIDELKIEFRRLLSPKRLKQSIKRSVIGEKSFWLRIVPSPLKDIITPSIYSLFGESQYTSGLSNMGVVQMPSEIEQFIERFECYPPPSIGNKVKAFMISYQKHLYFSFGNLSKDRMLEREFFRNIRKKGIDVAIETNDEEN